jgi:hypothetical protein
MRSTSAWPVAVFVLAAGCAEPPPTAVLDVFEAGAAMSLQATGKNTTVQLTGDAEVPPRETRARGTTILRLSDDGTELYYKLIVANIENVRQAHIHVGAADENGPVVAFLYGAVPAGAGRFSGVLAEGVITADDLVGPLAGEPLSELVAEMLAGNTYVNVHTDDGEPPANTGPGDFPGGEIRGQIR